MPHWRATFPCTRIRRRPHHIVEKIANLRVEHPDQKELFHGTCHVRGRSLWIHRQFWNASRTDRPQTRMGLQDALRSGEHLHLAFCDVLQTLDGGLDTVVHHFGDLWRRHERALVTLLVPQLQVACEPLQKRQLILQKYILAPSHGFPSCKLDELLGVLLAQRELLQHLLSSIVEHVGHLWLQSSDREHGVQAAREAEPLGDVTFDLSRRSLGVREDEWQESDQASNEERENCVEHARNRLRAVRY
mmetsp:Transcript_3063/g.8877  ORF Transcript_3063/g.8877 Transcript_3063/m.8877 type:complete len:246 (+) Transcript_3063:914-1651(+)